MQATNAPIMDYEVAEKKESIITFQNVEKQFGNVFAVKEMNLSVQEGEFLSILGPSGCGKTTTLRMIAGFEHPTGGTLILNGEPANDVPAYMRPVNTVFQNYALFPHMTIFNNIAFGLKQQKKKKSEIIEKVGYMLELMGLEPHKEKYPKQLSGGQQQRVALARALVNQPKVLLLDEPLGALDLKLRKKMQFELKKIHEKVGITFIYVTHDQEEALVMSDRIVVMNQGYIEQIGTPKEIYEQPETSFVADFIGEANILDVEYQNGLYQFLGIPIATQKKLTEKAKVVIRPEKIKIVANKRNNQSILLPAKIKSITYAGQKLIIETEVRGETIYVHSIEHPKFEKPDQVYLSIKDTDYILVSS